EAGPIEEVGELCRCVGRWTEQELRLNAIEDIPNALVLDITGKLAGYTGRTARRTECAAGQNRFEERLTRNRRNRLVLGKVGIFGEEIESLGKALSSGNHEERHLIQIDTLIDIPGRVSHVTDLQTPSRRQFALDSEVPSVVRTRLPLRVLHLRAGNERDIGAGH